MLFSKEELQILLELLTVHQSKLAIKENYDGVEKYEILKQKIRAIMMK